MIEIEVVPFFELIDKRESEENKFIYDIEK